MSPTVSAIMEVSLKKHADIVTCPRCEQANRLALLPGGVNAEYVVCQSCGYALPMVGKIPNFAEEISAQTTRLPWTQRIMETRLFARMYETPVWRPLHTWVSSGQNVDEQQAELLALAGEEAREVIVDLACGTGHFTRAFAQRWPEAAVFGLDLSLSMLGEGIRRARVAKLSNIVFLRGSIFKLPFADASVDHVNSCGALHLFTDQPQIWQEIARILKPGGLFTGEAIAMDAKIEKIQRMAMERKGARFLELPTFEAELKEAGFDGLEATQRKIILTFRARRRTAQG